MLLSHLPKLVGGFSTIPALEHTYPEGFPKLWPVNGMVKAWSLTAQEFAKLCKPDGGLSNDILEGSKGCQGWTGGQELGLKTRKSHKAGAGRTRPNEDSPGSLKLWSPGGGRMADSYFRFYLKCHLFRMSCASVLAGFPLLFSFMALCGFVHRTL